MIKVKRRATIFAKWIQLCLPLMVLPIPLFASAPSMGSISEGLMGPTELITKMVLVACYIVGVGLVIFALAQYKQHRISPKLVPLSTPIIMLILGVAALLIPYFSIVSGESASASEEAKREGRAGSKSGALPPMADHVKKTLPGPGRYTPSDIGDGSQNDSEYDDDDDDDDDDDVPSSGHWTDNND